MFGHAYGWRRQNWRLDPGPALNQRPFNYLPGTFIKRSEQEVLTVSTGNSSEADGSSSNLQPAGVCHVDLEQLQQEGLEAQGENDLDYDKLLFVDMDGDPVDGRSCDVIYEDRDPDSRVRIVVDEDGNVIDVYTEDDPDNLWEEDSREGVDDGESHVTADLPVITATSVATASSARPGGSETSLSGPESTVLTTTRMGAMVTLAPAV